MKRFLLILLFFILTTGFSHADNTIDTPNPQSEVERGYRGTLPDIYEEFKYKRKTTFSKPIINPGQNILEKDFVKSPRDNKLFVDIIVKKDKTTKYVNDINELLPLLRNIQKTIDNDLSVQIFNAQVASLIDNVNFLQTKYENQPERDYASFKYIIKLSNQARNVAILRAQALVYNKYLAYEGEGAIYRDENIEAQIKKLEESLKKTIFVIEQEQ